MIAIEGYKVTQKIRQEGHTAFYEALSDSESMEVQVVHHATEGLTAEIIHDLEKRFKRVQAIQSDKLVRVLDLKIVKAAKREEVIFVCENHNAKPLKDFITAIRSDLRYFFEFAIGLAEITNLLHQKDVLLKEVNPKTLLVRSSNGSVMVNTPSILLAPFNAIAQREARDFYETDFITDYLPYISPEQTGRMNRQADYRSDFYSFGVLFYELLTGRVPFSADEPLELIHSHIARQPVPPNKIRMDIPEMLAKITLKLLAKMPEDRYQSAFGLLSDLRRCSRDYMDDGFIAAFALGNRDTPERLQLSKKIFGREEQLAILLAIFEKVKQGSSEAFNISGPPGIGKTRLVEELQRFVHEAGGYFGTGRFDPFHRNIPYSGIIKAVRAVISKILSESPENLAYWRSRFLEQLGRNIGLVIDIIPDLECIVGEQPKPPELLPDKAEKAFLNACSDFLNVFAQQKHPLVIFLDDMQWIDMASLVLIEHVMTGMPMPHVFFIGTFRDNEVSMTHPLSILFERFQSKGIPVGSMSLPPLGVEHIRQTIIDSLSKNVSNVQALAELVLLKTNGNPFFVGQFIQSLYQRKLLYFDFQNGVWRWDEQGIKAQAFTDNVIELMSGELQTLHQETQNVLKIAACIGNRFDFKLLAAINDRPLKDTTTALMSAIDNGYIIANGESYELLQRLLKEIITGNGQSRFDVDFGDENCFEFLHDRVHQAVYSLLPIKYRRPIHLKIGRFLLKQKDRQKIQDNIFHVVNQLNYGLDLVIGVKEKVEVAQLYLTAGRKAKEGAAYLLAGNYYDSGISLLPDDSWEDHYDLAFSLYKEKMECAFLSRNFDEAGRLFDFLLDRTRSALDKATLLNFMMIMLASSGRHHEAVQMGADALNLLGQNFPLKVGRYDVTIKFLWLRIRLSKRRVLSLADLPEIQDPRQQLIMKIMLDMAFSVTLLDPDLFIIQTIKIFGLTLKYGNSPTACLGYAYYGAYLCSALEDYTLGNSLGELALSLSEKLERPHPTKILLWYGGSISFWRHHLRVGLEYCRKGMDYALESGDFLFAGYHMIAICAFIFSGGTPLEEVNAEIDKHLDFMRQSKDTGNINAIISLRQVVRCLRGETKSHLSIDDAEFSEADHIQQVIENNPQTLLTRHYVLKLQLLYLMGDYQGAMEMAQRSARLIRYSAGSFLITEFFFYRCLTMLAVYPHVTPQKKRKYKKSIRRYIRRFQRMGKSCAPNFKHMLLILMGEKAHLDGLYDKAFSCFKDAVNLAEENGFTQMAALANELSAKLALKQGLHTLAKVFLQEANTGYLKWGALAKSQLLVRNYPQFLPNSGIGPLHASRQIDYATVVSALQAISTEIVLDRLLKKLMKIVVENAGAQRVLFLLKLGDDLVVKASSNVGGPIRLTNQNMPVQHRDDLLLSGLHYVQHTQNPVIIEDAQVNSEYRSDPYAIQYKPKSIVCLPVLRQSDLVAVLYLENNIVTGAFTPDRIEILQLIASQAAISIENARLYENVMQKERDLLELSEKLRSLSSELLLTEERERRRIAVDLHDRIGHALANVKMQLGVLKQTIDNPESLDPIERISQLTDQSIQDTQSLTFDLSPPVLYDLGLEAAIEWLVDQTQEQHRLSVAFEDDQKPKPLDESIRVLAFQAARELLFNIVKHAQAHHVWVSMKQVGEMVHITIEDDGIGLQASMQGRKTNKKGGGFGLFSIQERLKHAGGRLEISSDPSHGTRMVLIVPMQIIQEDRE